MKIYIENIGAIQSAEMELGNFTIICGTNNSGKTYVTYALYGFLYFWQDRFNIQIEKDIIQKLKDKGFVTLSLNTYIDDAQKIIDEACKEYTEFLPEVYAAQPRLFDQSSFRITIDSSELKVLESSFSLEMKSSNSKSEALKIHKNQDEKELAITLFVEDSDEEMPNFIISDTLSDAIKKAIFSSIFPNAFIASAERTGAAIFSQELDFARNRMLAQIRGGKINLADFLRKQKSDYALPVEHNVEFVRNLQSASKNESFLLKQDENVIGAFTNILGGDYQVTRNGELFFLSRNGGIKLTMDECSSSVRSLLDLGFYLKHVARKNDLLIIDEPELNLHPENQRNIARLLARLINSGLKIFVTTHSDYILRELSNLILLNDPADHIKALVEREGYAQQELIKASDLKIYMAQKALRRKFGAQRSSNIQTLVSTAVDDQSGIQTSCFDDTIDTMNRIQDEIFYGGQ